MANKVTAGDVQFTRSQYREAQHIAYFEGVNANQVIVRWFYDGRLRLTDDARRRLAENVRVRGCVYTGRYER